jgi:hypothetical protein
LSARATVFNTTLLGVEVTKGTSVSPVKRLLATGFNLKPKVPVVPFRPMGSKYATTAVRQKEHTEGDIEGTLSFNDICWLASGLLETAAITTPSGATNTRRWTWNPAVFGPDDNVAFTVQMGSSVRAEQAGYVLIDGLTLRVTKEQAAISGNIIGQELTESITLSTGRNEVQTVTIGTNTAGQFNLTYSGQTTADLAFSVSGAAVQAALIALSNIGPSDVSVTGPAGGPWIVTFTGTLAAQDVSLMTLADGGTPLSGGTGQTVTTTTGGLALADVAEQPVDPNLFTLYAGSSLASEVQTITRQATGGTFTLTFTDLFANSETTAAIAYNATGANVQTALENLAIINTGDVTVTGAASGPWILTFGGRFAGLNMPMLTFNDGALTGVTLPALAIVQTTAGGLTLLDKALEFEWSLTDRFTPRMDLRADEPSFTEHVEKAPKQTLQLVMEHDTTAAAFMANLRAKDTKFIRLEAVGAVIETVSSNVYNYRYKQTWAFKFTDNDRSNQDDTWGSTFDMEPIYSSTLGGVTELIVDNQMTALEA